MLVCGKTSNVALLVIIGVLTSPALGFGVEKL